MLLLLSIGSGRLQNAAGSGALRAGRNAIIPKTGVSRLYRGVGHLLRGARRLAGRAPDPRRAAVSSPPARAIWRTSPGNRPAGAITRRAAPVPLPAGRW